jgi:hypothetical protein
LARWATVRDAGRGRGEEFRDDGVLAGRDGEEIEDTEAPDELQRVGLVATGGIGLAFDALLV